MWLNQLLVDDHIKKNLKDHRLSSIHAASPGFTIPFISGRTPIPIPPPQSGGGSSQGQRPITNGPSPEIFGQTCHFQPSEFSTASSIGGFSVYLDSHWTLRLLIITADRLPLLLPHSSISLCPSQSLTALHNVQANRSSARR